MAWLIRVDGTFDNVHPSNQTEFTREELTILVGSDELEYVNFRVRPPSGAIFCQYEEGVKELPIGPKTIMIVDEISRLRKEPPEENVIASILYGAMFHGISILGTALLVEPREIGG